MAIRQLKPGELIPVSQPKRYVAGEGYVRLRWRIGVREYVETYEHRVEGDRVTAAEHVHHRNSDRQDNSPTNLEALTAKAHSQRHGPARLDEVISLYTQGLSTTQIGRILGRDNSAVYRALQRRGLIEQRSSATYAKPLPSDEEIRDWHARGVRVGGMLRLCPGVSRKRIERRMAELGLPRFPPGRPCVTSDLVEAEAC